MLWRPGSLIFCICTGFRLYAFVHVCVNECKRVSKQFVHMSACITYGPLHEFICTSVFLRKHTHVLVVYIMTVTLSKCLRQQALEPPQQAHT
jgi:hypothetical protein